MNGHAIRIILWGFLLICYVKILQWVWIFFWMIYRLLFVVGLCLYVGQQLFSCGLISYVRRKQMYYYQKVKCSFVSFCVRMKWKLSCGTDFCAHYPLKTRDLNRSCLQNYYKGPEKLPCLISWAIITACSGRFAKWSVFILRHLPLRMFLVTLWPLFYCLLLKLREWE